LATKRKLKKTLHNALKNVDNNPNFGHSATLKRHVNVQGKHLNLMTIMELEYWG
jgi:DNA topoisomerase IB